MVESDCLASVAAHHGKPRRGWLRFMLLVACILPLLGLAGCGSATYNCAPPGCRSAVTLNKANFGLSGAGIPWAVNTSMYVAPVRCDDTCRASSGNTDNPGNIVTFVMLTDGTYRIALGYGTDTFGDQQFFLDTYTADIPYHRQWLGPTGVTTAGNAYTVRLMIYATDFSDSPLCPAAAPKSWIILLGYPNNAPNGGGGYYYDPLGDSEFGPLCTAFMPTSLVLGQYLLGTSGGYADYTYFSETQYSVTFPSSDNWDGLPRTGNSYTFPIDLHYLTADGDVSTSSSPPFVGWNTAPSKNTVAGGIFYMECCTAPCDTLFC